LRSAGVIIGPRNEAQRVKARYHLAEEIIARVPNPLDLHLWRPIERAFARRELGLSIETRIVICHGRIDVHRKGLDVLVAAWADVRAKCPSLDAQLVLIGSGEDAANFSKLLATQVSSQITWLNEYIQDRSLMRMWLSAANLYVMASRHEGFPVAPLEAMACGLPIIISDVPGGVDILGSEDALPGMVVPVGDSAALANALVKLLTDPVACEHFSGRALNRARDFSVEDIGTSLRAFLFEKVAPTAS
jgi:starch synthase